jgi:hypothetical protein
MILYQHVLAVTRWLWLVEIGNPQSRLQRPLGGIFEIEQQHHHLENLTDDGPTSYQT